MTEPESGSASAGPLPGDAEDTPPGPIPGAPSVPGSTRAGRGSMRRSQWSPTPSPAGGGGPGSAGRETTTKPPLLLGLAVVLVIAVAVIVVLRGQGSRPPAKPAITSSSASAHPSSGTGTLQPLGSTPGGKGKPATRRTSAPDAEYPQRLQKTAAVATLVTQADKIP